MKCCCYHFIFVYYKLVMDTIIEEKILQDYKDYCELNNIDLGKFINKTLRNALLVEKYGDSPFPRHEQEPYAPPAKNNESKSTDNGEFVTEKKLEVEVTPVKKTRPRKPKKEEIKVDIKEVTTTPDGEKIIVKKRPL